MHDESVALMIQAINVRDLLIDTEEKYELPGRVGYRQLKREDDGDALGCGVFGSRVVFPDGEVGKKEPNELYFFETNPRIFLLGQKPKAYVCRFALSEKLWRTYAGDLRLPFTIGPTPALVVEDCNYRHNILQFGLPKKHVCMIGAYVLQSVTCYTRTKLITLH
ncbi:hypothetical protein M0R45_013662 [Rubus argutus]|uniref:Uncharacterized protein n=1 Tax=Rubus argutus TaxID=59490 RepID=A0AAW1XL66_RUBAR